MFVCLQKRAFPKQTTKKWDRTIVDKILFYETLRLTFKAVRYLSRVFSPSSACLDRLQRIVQNWIQTSYLVNWILAVFNSNKLISSIFCFHIDSAPSSLFQKVAFWRPLTVKWSPSPDFCQKFANNFRQQFFPLTMATKMVAAWSADQP